MLSLGKYGIIGDRVKKRSINSDIDLQVANISTDSDFASDSHDVEVIDTLNEDVENRFSNCKKHPGHNQFIPVQYFNLKHLPESCRDDDVLDMTQAVAKLTVRVGTHSVSHHRPKFWPGSKKAYPFHGERDGKLRYGSGRIEQVTRQDASIGSTNVCPCSKCKNSKEPREAWWLIRVSTAAHLVYDDIEAKCTTCTLFYDSKDGEPVNIEGLRIQTKDVKRDICKLLCVVCDSNLADKIDKYVDKFVAAWERVFDKFFGDDEFENEKLAMIVHHPHGYFKHVSIGRWKEKFTEQQGDAILKQYTYDTPTCPGSAGAYVLVPDFKVG